ncbi:hypothetical protein CHCC14814_3851 [Bacillus paralicheniformis]|nr:hypothetical protein CHCC14814_3851 [Bacillus paralicheniformis]
MKTLTNIIKSKNILNISTCYFTEFFMCDKIKAANGAKIAVLLI